MKVIHVLRKPCSESTVAANVLRWGTGAVNVDACRVGAGRVDTRHGGGNHSDHIGQLDPEAKGYALPGGRWPANLVLQHLDGCRCEGTRSVKTSGWRDTDAHKGDEGVSNNFGASGITGRHYGENGEETVAAWTCEPGCPVAALDEQSGFLHARGNQTPTKRGSGGIFWNGSGHGVDPVDSGDSGGASRFFKQFGGSPTTATPRPPTPDDPVPSGGRRGDG